MSKNISLYTMLFYALTYCQEKLCRCNDLNEIMLSHYWQSNCDQIRSVMNDISDDVFDEIDELEE